MAQSSEAGLANRNEDDRRAIEQLHQSPKPGRVSLESLDDDQTLSARVPVHQPTKEAKKAAVRGAKLSRKGKHQDAIREFKSALALDPLFYPAGNNLALEYLKERQIDLALQEWRDFTIRFPEHVLLFNNYAGVPYDLKLYFKAEAVAREALKLHPRSFRANLILGQALVAEGRWTAEAKQSLRFASAVRPEATALLDKWPSS